MKNSKPGILILVLNAAAILFYFFILTRLLSFEEIPENLFYTGDSREYYGYGQWIAGASDYCNPVRTFFYPLVLLLSTALLGSYGPWIMQFIFWLVSCNLVFLSLRALNAGTILSSAGFIVSFTFLPLIGYSTHALTELTVFLLLSVLIYVISKNAHQLSSAGALLKILFIISLLAATKPVYQVAWYAVLAGFIFYSFRSILNLRATLSFLLACSPVLIQKGISLSTHSTLSSTSIANSNLKNYFYRKIKFYVENGKAQDFNLLPDSIHAVQQKAIAHVSTSETITYLLQHPAQAAFTFIENLSENIGSGYPYIDTSKNLSISKWMGFFNKVMMCLHIPVFISWMISLLFFRKKIPKERYLPILFTGLMLYYIYFTSGLVFWAGDRLISPAVSLWICCYFILGLSFISLVRNPNMTLNAELVKDIIQWDVKNWSQVLGYWEKEVEWKNISTCLELGAREGGLSLWLALKGKKIVCSDLKDIKLTAAKLHKKYNVGGFIEYWDLDATNIPYENQFDLIVFKSVIGGIGREDNKEIQKEVFRQIHKALKPGGKLLFAENLTASPLHRFFRKKFNKWGSYWRYLSISETKEFLGPFSSFKFETTGFLSSFGRSESQRSLLAVADKFVFNHLVPDSWKQIVYGVAEK